MVAGAQPQGNRNRTQATAIRTAALLSFPRQCHPLWLANDGDSWKLKLVMAAEVGTTSAGDAGAAHTGDMGRKIGTILGVILAIWVAFMAVGWIFAMVKTFLIVGLIAVVVFITVTLVAGKPRRS